MTRSNDPFEDLPEWKERRRLQEAEELRQRSVHEAEGYQDNYAANAASGAPSAPYASGYDHSGQAGGGEWDNQPSRYPPQDAGYAAPTQPYQGFEEPAYRQEGVSNEQFGWPQGHEPMNPEAGDRGRLRDDAYQQPVFQPPLPSASSASLDDYRPDGGPATEPGFGAPPPFFGEAPAGDRDGYQQASYGDGDAEGYDDDYDYEYDDEDDEEARGYGWKMVAGLVVVGAVVAGGGFFLYDTLAGGGAGGPTPIIKADRGPAKTAPAEPGGKSFANQDSKLLGRLDNSQSTRRAALDDDGRNRVREVPTVRVSPDGRLIMPKASAAEASGGSVGTPSVPGINIVDNLSGSRSGLGAQGLPPVVPKSAEPQGGPAPRAALATPARQPASSPSQPIIRNGRGALSSPSGNLATARSSSPPPVPQKSAISTGWRMTGTSTPARAPAPQRIAAAPQTTASTLGAGSVARQSSRQYIAVIATKSSRMAALQSFAELQQRHPGTLSNRTPSVQKADLSARGLGTMYRLLVGPAGSRKAANEVCASLKASGYSGCWVKTN